MVRIGTRAIISINSKPMLATHWDGDPSYLGRKLLACDKSFEEVVRVAQEHIIDSAHKSIRLQPDASSDSESTKKYRRTDAMCADDHETSDIKDYSDWAEFEYDIRGPKVYFRPLEGSYPFSLTRAL